MWVTPDPPPKSRKTTEPERHPLSNRLVFGALVIWLASLLLPGLALYKGYWTGLLILLVGWSAIPAGIPAWLANIFFIFAIGAFPNRKDPPTFISLIALLCALTTFIIFTEGREYGGGGATIYGLGWGGFLWLLAMPIPLIACAVRDNELSQRPITVRNILGSASGSLGIAVWITVFVVCAGLGIYDRWYAEGMDKQLLRYAVFKAQPVCRTPDVPTLHSLTLAGPLEIVPKGERRPILTQPEEILAWGIPRVRLGQWDYYLANPNDWRSVVTVPASGPAGARLEVSQRKLTEYRHVTHARLVSADGKILGFDGTWPEPEDPEKYACPRYSPMGEIDQPPATLLLDALRPPQGGRFPPPKKARSLVTRHYRPDDVSLIGTISEAEIGENIECQANVGIRHRHPAAGQTGLPEEIWRAAQDIREVFQVADKYYWLSYDDQDHALCDGDVAYLYTINTHTGIGLEIHPHSLPSFSPEKPGTWWLRFDVPEELTSPGKVLIRSLARHGKRIQLTVAVFPKEREVGTLLQVSASIERTCTKHLDSTKTVRCE